TWVQVGSASRAFTAPRLGIIVGANDSGGTSPVATIQSVQVTLDSPPTAPALKLNATGLSFSMTAGASAPSPQTIGITNEGAGTLVWSAALSGAGSWLSVNPAEGSGAGTITVSVDAAGLPAGTYTKTITVTAPGAENSPRTVP